MIRLTTVAVGYCLPRRVESDQDTRTKPRSGYGSGRSRLISACALPADEVQDVPGDDFGTSTLVPVRGSRMSESTECGAFGVWTVLKEGQRSREIARAGGASQQQYRTCHPVKPVEFMAGFSLEQKVVMLSRDQLGEGHVALLWSLVVKQELSDDQLCDRAWRPS